LKIEYNKIKTSRIIILIPKSMIKREVKVLPGTSAYRIRKK
jgi:hypothetical protein